MDKLEMIERLRGYADISYEEAKEILGQTGDDLAEAVVLLERQGRLRKPEAEPSKGQTQEMQEESSQEEQLGEQQGKEPGKEKESSFRNSLRSFFRFLKHTSFHVTRKGENLITMPSWTLAVALVPFWEAILPAMLIALFFGCRYSFDGKADTDAANEILGKVGSFADGVESGMQK